MNCDFSNLVVEDILRIVKINKNAGDIKEMPKRASMGIIVALEGEVVYTHLGREFISDKNHVLVMPKGISYSFTSKTDSCSVVINFEAKNSPMLDTIVSFEEDQACFAKQIENLWVFEKASYKLRCMSSLYSFFIAHNADSSVYLPSSKWKTLNAGMEYLEANYSNPELNNDMLAAAAGVSTVYFRKLFSQKFGIAPMQYVRQKRIDRAKSLLTSEYFSSVTEVAAAVGFSNIYHFSKIFKQMTSVSPSDYILMTKASKIP